MNNKGFTLLEMFIVLFLILVVVFILLPALPHRHEPAYRASCQNNLKQMGLVFRMYANENEGGYYPPPMVLSKDKKGFIPIPSRDAIYPEYVTDPYVLMCPGNKSASEFNKENELIQLIDNEDSWKNFSRYYNYYGWMIDYDWAIYQEQSNELMIDSSTATKRINAPSLPKGLTGTEQVPAQIVALYEAVIEAQKTAEENTPSILTQDLTVGKGLGNFHYSEIIRLREGIEHYLFDTVTYQTASARIQSDIPIMWDTPAFNPKDLPHNPGGLNVLYMDGHAEFIQYPADRFPVTEGMAVWSRFNEVLLWGE